MTDIDALDLDNLVALDSRKVSSNGNAAWITIPDASDLDLTDQKQELEASVSVRIVDGEIRITARISRE